MSSLQGCVASGACALLVVLSATAGPETRSISGTVQTADDAPVVRTEVRIDGAGANVTTDSGEFVFPLLPPLKVGFPTTFRVTGWVVFDPCVLARGRMYLPDPQAESISIRVLRPRDRQLLSGRSMGCLVEENASRFEPRSTSTKVPHASFQVAYYAAALGDDQRSLGNGATRPCSASAEPWQRELERRLFAEVNAQRAQHGLPSLIWNDAVAHQAREHSCRMAKLGFFSHDDPERGSSPERLGRAGIQSSGSAENIYRESGVSSTQQPAKSAKPARDRFVARQADELGFKSKQLTSAIDRWAKSVSDPYDKGLAALYKGRYAEASRYIFESIASSARNVLPRYVALARAEYEQGNDAAAEADLRRVLAAHPGDPIILDNLAIVLGNRTPASADLVGRAVQFWMHHAVHQANILDRFFDQTGVGIVASQNGGYFVTQLFIAALPPAPRRPRTATGFKGLAQKSGAGGARPEP